MTPTTETPTPRRVRTRDLSGTTGTVFDVDPPSEGGWVYWVDDRYGCHVSKPDYLEEVKS